MNYGRSFAFRNESRFSYVIWDTLIFFLVIIGVNFWGASVWALDSAAAKAALDEAFVKYHQAMRNLPSPTAEQIKSLEKQILAPAQEMYNQARQEEAKANFESAKKESIAHDAALKSNKVIKGDRPPDAQWIKKYGKPVPSGVPISPVPSAAESFRKGGVLAPAVVSPPSGPSRPEYQLDSNGIPKEIEFPGRRSK